MSNFGNVISAMSGLVARWQLDETSGTAAADATGGGKTGTYAGGFSLNQTSLLAGDVVGKAVTFDGSNGRMSVAGLDGWLNGRTAFTLGLWLKTSTLNVDKAVFGWWWTYFGGFRGGSSSTARAEFQFSGGSVGANSTLVGNGAAHFVVVTVDTAAGWLRVYTNGSLSNSAAVSGTLASTSSDRLAVASYQSSGGVGGNYLAGSVDEPFLFDRALSGAEVTSLYNAGLSSGVKLLLMRRRRAA